MEGNHHVNWNTIIYRKGAIYRTEEEKPFLAAKGFSTNLVQFLTSHVIIGSMHVCSFTWTMTHVHGPAPETALHARNLVHEKLKFYVSLLSTERPPIILPTVRTTKKLSFLRLKSNISNRLYVIIMSHALFRVSLLSIMSSLTHNVKGFRSLSSERNVCGSLYRS